MITHTLVQGASYIYKYKLAPCTKSVAEKKLS